MSNHPTDKTLPGPETEIVDHSKPPLLIQEPTAPGHLLLGGFAGLGAAVLGAILWALVTVTTHYQIGWMAVGLGWLVGVTVRFFGKGTTPSFGVVGAGVSVLGCLAGNALSICMVALRQEGLALVDLPTYLPPTLVVELLLSTFTPVDLLFYGLAVYEGYKFSFRRVPQTALPHAQ
jgi:hypothetical protein